MSTKVPQNIEDQEVDLGVIFKKTGDFFGRINSAIFNIIQFFARNWIIIITLVVIGFGLGTFLNKVQKCYEHQIIVTANFGSTDYLYSKIDLIQSKIESEDTVFLKEVVGIKEPKNLAGIKIKSINDVYNFIKNKPENFELIKLLAEDGNVNEVIADDITSKNYTYQRIIVATRERTSEEKLVKPLLTFLNDSDYFKKIQKEVYNNTTLKIRQNDSIVKQIDGILNNFSSEAKYANKSDKLLYNNENTQLNDIIKTKDLLLAEQGIHKIELIGFDQIIKESSATLNIESSKFLNRKLKFLLPILFIFLFVFVKGFKRFYNKEKLKALQQIN